MTGERGAPSFYLARLLFSETDGLTMRIVSPPRRSAARRASQPMIPPSSATTRVSRWVSVGLAPPPQLDDSLVKILNL
jgi:hypothetical protein